MSRREFFRRYELVEAEAEAIERSAAPPAADGSGEWPDELRDVLRKVSRSSARPSSSRGRWRREPIEVGEMVVLFRVVTKNPPPAAESREAGRASQRRRAVRPRLPPP